jgi:hypothetical protein
MRFVQHVPASVFLSLASIDVSAFIVARTVFAVNPISIVPKIDCFDAERSEIVMRLAWAILAFVSLALGCN